MRAMAVAVVLEQAHELAMRVVKAFGGGFAHD